MADKVKALIKLAPKYHGSNSSCFRLPENSAGGDCRRAAHAA